MDTRVHISLEVSDLSKSVAFYSALFQRDPTKIQSDYANFRMDSPQLHLALVHTPERRQELNGNRHYGIELFDDSCLEEWLKSAISFELPTRIEKNVTCCYAVANKFWTKDPDGHEWEFWIRSAEAESTNVFNTEKNTETISVDSPSCCAPGKCG